MIKYLTSQRNELLEQFFIAQQKYTAAVEDEVDFYDLQLIREKINNISQSIQLIQDQFKVHGEEIHA